MGDAMRDRRRPPRLERALAAGLLLAAAIGVAACSGGGGADAAPGAADGNAPAAGGSAAAAPTGVPVRVDRVRRASLDLVVTAPGQTAALRQNRVRAPFPARLVSLHVIDGDRVEAGQAVAEIVAKNSEAALQGAEAMRAAARTAEDEADADRAVALAQRNLVRQTLRAPASGVVLSHGAESGDYVDEGEVLVTVVESRAVFFEAQLSQDDLARIRPGQRARIEMPAAGGTVGATVHGILPAASSQSLSAPVRLDLTPPRPGMTVGLFGTARIVVGRRENAAVVPAGAVLRDDVSGVSSIAVVRGDKARWVVVTTGVREGDRVEIVSPDLAAGTTVITDGQVGLPEGATIRVQP